MARTKKELSALWKKAKTQTEKDALHAEADKLRGYTTETTVSNGKYYQTPVKMDGSLTPKAAQNIPKKTPAAPVASSFRNAPAPTKITPEQQKKNQATAVAELNGKNGNIASLVRGAGIGLATMGMRSFLPGGTNKAQEDASLKNAIPYKSTPNAQAIRMGYKPQPQETSKIKFQDIGEVIGSSVGVDPVGLALNKIIKTGAARLAANSAKVPILVNGKTVFVDAATQGMSKNIPAPAPRIVPKTPIAASQNIPAPTPRAVPRQAEAIRPASPVSPIIKAQQEAPPVSPQIAPQPRNPQLGAVAPRGQAMAQNGGIPSQKFVPLGADTNLFPPKMKVSEFKSNTLDNTPDLSDEVKAQLKDEDFANPVIGEKQQLQEARQRIEVDPEGEFNDLQHKEIYDGVDTTTAMELMSKLGNEAEKTGDFSKVIQLAKATHEKIHGNAQSLQALAKYTRTPEGTIIEAQRMVDKVERDIRNKNPNLIGKIDRETQQVMDLIGNAEKDTFEPIGDIIKRFISEKGGKAGKATEKKELTPAEMLARKVASTTKEAATKEPDAVKDMVNELFRVAKESPLVKRPKTDKRNPIEFLTGAIQNKSQYADVWDKAKVILKDKYKDKPDALSMLDDYFDKGIVPTYSEATLKGSINKSAKELGIDFNKIIKQSNSDKQTALRNIAEYLIRETGSNQADAVRLASDVMRKYDEILKARTESALKQMFPEAYGKQIPIAKKQKTVYEKVMDLINMGAYDKQNVRDVIKAKNKLPILENSDIKAILENMKLSEAQTDTYMKEMYAARAGKIIANKEPSDGVEKAKAALTSSMLLNPKTLAVRNPGGNIISRTLDDMSHGPATVVDKLVSLKTGERARSVNPLVKLPASAQGAKQGLLEWAKDIKYGVDTSPTRGMADLPRKSIVYSEDHKIANPQVKAVMDTAGKVGNAVYQTVGHLLKLGDRPFFQSGFNARVAELESLAKNHKLYTDPATGKTVDISADAMQEGLALTLQNDSWFAKTFAGIGSKPTDPLPYRVLSFLILPFKYTPGNILDKFIDYSGLGIARATGHALATAGKGKFNQKYFSDTMGKGLTGGGLITLGYLMAQKGLVTGGYDPNNKIEKTETALGKTNYAFKIGDTYQTFDWALPASGPIALGAEFYRAKSESKDPATASLKGLEGAVNALFSLSVLQGPANLMSGYSPAASITKTLMGTTSMVTPTGGKQIAQMVDDYTRETYDPNGTKQLINKTVARIPFASKMLPIKQDVFGNDIKNFQGKNNIGNVMLNPGTSTTYKPDAEQKEVMRLYTENGLTDQLPVVAPKSFTKDGTPYEFSANDYVNYQKTVGQYSHSKVFSLINTPEYKAKSDTDKAAAIKEINDAAVDAARVQYFKNNGLSPLLVLDKPQREKYAKISALGVSEDQYLNTYNATKGIEGVKDDFGNTIRLSESFNKKNAIDAANPGASPVELRALYHTFDVSQKVW